MATKKNLIAQVATAVMVNGQRRIVQPGQPLPEVDARDEKALLAAKAARAVPEQPADPPKPADANTSGGAAPKNKR
jgi:hypothetical protein